MFLYTFHVSAQNDVYDNTFVRIYNVEGKKTNKGKIMSISKSSIELYSRGNTLTIPLHTIGIIKTKRSAGNNIGKGALIGGSSLALIGLLSGDDKGGFISFTAADKTLFGLVSGSLFGGLVGGITAIFKNSDHFIIDGNEMALEKFRNRMLRIE